MNHGSPRHTHLTQEENGSIIPLPMLFVFIHVYQCYWFSISSSPTVQLNHQPQVRPAQINLRILSSVFNQWTGHDSLLPEDMPFLSQCSKWYFWTNARSTHPPKEGTHSGALFSDKACRGEWAAIALCSWKPSLWKWMILLATSYDFLSAHCM